MTLAEFYLHRLPLVHECYGRITCPVCIAGEAITQLDAAGREIKRLRALAESLAARIAAQSELLSKTAERPGVTP